MNRLTVADVVAMLRGMSITFYLEVRPNDRHSHGFCPAECEEFVAYRYCDHIEDERAACPDCSLEVNVSNTNAALILERLGVEFDYCGSLSADEAYSRAMLANVGRDDSGQAASVSKAEGGATWVDCGLEAGYFDRQMSRIATLAEAGMAQSRKVVWA